MNKDRYVYGYEVPLNVPTQSVPVITDTLNGKQYYSLREVIELLNGYEMLCLILININSELHNSITELKVENEQLKQEHKIAINEMITDYKNLEKDKYYVEIKKENEQLRKDKEILKERLRECRILLNKFNCR